MAAIGKRSTYVYCLVSAGDAPAAAAAPRGLPGCGPVRILDGGAGLWLVVADAPTSRYGAASIDAGLEDLDWVAPRALAHERVVEHFAAAGACVPMKLFTLFDSDERARARVAGMRRRLKPILARLAGRDEWGVRVRRTTAPARAAQVTRAARSGADFLRAKQRQRDEARLRVEAAAREAEAIFVELERTASEALRRPVPPGSLLLDAVFLVPASRQGAPFRRLAAALADRGGDGFDVQVSGPWPAYHFVAGQRA